MSVPEVARALVVEGRAARVALEAGGVPLPVAHLQVEAVLDAAPAERALGHEREPARAGMLESRGAGMLVLNRRGDRHGAAAVHHVLRDMGLGLALAALVGHQLDGWAGGAETQDGENVNLWGSLGGVECSHLGVRIVYCCCFEGWLWNWVLDENMILL